MRRAMRLAMRRPNHMVRWVATSSHARSLLATILGGSGERGGTSKSNALLAHLSSLRATQRCWEVAVKLRRWSQPG